MKKCKTCKFFQMVWPDTRAGECHKKPPVITGAVESHPLPAGMDGAGGVWPKVMVFEGCGKWKPIPVNIDVFLDAQETLRKCVKRIVSGESLIDPEHARDAFLEIVEPLRERIAVKESGE